MTSSEKKKRLELVLQGRLFSYDGYEKNRERDMWELILKKKVPNEEIPEAYRTNKIGGEEHAKSISDREILERLSAHRETKAAKEAAKAAKAERRSSVSTVAQQASPVVPPVPIPNTAKTGKSSNNKHVDPARVPSDNSHQPVVVSISPRPKLPNLQTEAELAKKSEQQKQEQEERRQRRREFQEQQQKKAAEEAEQRKSQAEAAMRKAEEQLQAIEAQRRAETQRKEEERANEEKFREQQIEMERKRQETIITTVRRNSITSSVSPHSPDRALPQALTPRQLSERQLSSTSDDSFSSPSHPTSASSPAQKVQVFVSLKDSSSDEEAGTISYKMLMISRDCKMEALSQLAEKKYTFPVRLFMQEDEGAGEFSTLVEIDDDDTLDAFLTSIPLSANKGRLIAKRVEVVKKKPVIKKLPLQAATVQRKPSPARNESPSRERRTSLPGTCTTTTTAGGSPHPLQGPPPLHRPSVDSTMLHREEEPTRKAQEEISFRGGSSKTVTVIEPPPRDRRPDVNSNEESGDLVLPHRRIPGLLKRPPPRNANVSTLAGRSQKPQIFEHGACVYSVSLSRDGKRMVTACKDKTVQVWDLELATSTVLIDANAGAGLSHKGAALCCEFSHSEDEIVSGSEDGEIKTWDIKTGKVKKHIKGGHKGKVFSVHYTPGDSAYLISCSSDGLKVWGKADGKCKSSLTEHKAPVYTCTLGNLDFGKLLASGSEDQCIKIWNWKAEQCLKTLKGHTESVWALRFNSDDTKLVSVCKDAEVICWSTSHGTPLFSIKAHQESVHDILFTENDKYFITCSRDWSIRIFEANEDGRRVETLTGHRHCVYRLASINVESQGGGSSSLMMASASFDGTVRLWNLPSMFTATGSRSSTTTTTTTTAGGISSGAGVEQRRVAQDRNEM